MKKIFDYIIIFGFPLVIVALGFLVVHPMVMRQVIGLYLIYKGGKMFQDSMSHIKKHKELTEKDKDA